MAYNSSTVTAGDDILASQYNNLRTDVTEIRDADGNITVAATDKLYLDGGGDTYIYESAANIFRIYVAGNDALTITSALAYTGGDHDFAVTATKKLYLDSGGDSYIVEGSANTITVYAGGNVSCVFTAGQIYADNSGRLVNSTEAAWFQVASATQLDLYMVLK